MAQDYCQCELIAPVFDLPVIPRPSPPPVAASLSLEFTPPGTLLPIEARVEAIEELPELVAVRQTGPASSEPASTENAAAAAELPVRTRLLPSGLVPIGRIPPEDDLP